MQSLIFFSSFLPSFLSVLLYFQPLFSLSSYLLFIRHLRFLLLSLFILSVFLSSRLSSPHRFPPSVSLSLLLTFVFDSVNETSPCCFHDFFLLSSSVHQYSTRQASQGDLYMFKKKRPSVWFKVYSISRC